MKRIRNEDIKKAMSVLGITDIHTEYAYVKKVHKKLLLKWHPDTCSADKVEEYTRKCAEINAAFDVLEKAYELGMMGPGAKDFTESSNENSSNETNTNTESSYTHTNDTNSSDNSKQDGTAGAHGYDYQSAYNSYFYYKDMRERQQREREQREYERREQQRKEFEKMCERKHYEFLIHNAVWNIIFYAICFRHIYNSLTETDLAYKNMLIKETPYYLSVLIVIFYALKLIYVTMVLDGGESEILPNFCKLFVPIAFVFPIIYTFLHGVEAAMIFYLYFFGWVAFEWMMDVRIYANLERMSIGTIKGKKVSLPFVIFGTAELIAIAFGTYVAIAAIYIK